MSTVSHTSGTRPAFEANFLIEPSIRQLFQAQSIWGCQRVAPAKWPGTGCAQTRLQPFDHILLLDQSVLLAANCQPRPSLRHSSNACAGCSHSVWLSRGRISTVVFRDPRSLYGTSLPAPHCSPARRRRLCLGAILGNMSPATVSISARIYIFVGRLPAATGVEI